MRLGLVFSVAGLAACSDTSVKTVNSGPEAIIASHSTGDTVREGDTETVIGQVGDADHALEDLSVTWLQDGEAVCTDSAPDSTGNVLCPMTFAVGGGEVSLMVRDPRGAADSASVNLDVQPTDAPTAELLSPTAEGVYYSDELIAFQGRVSDTEDSIDALTISFETDADGDLGLELNVTSEGEVEAFGELPEGEHAVRIKVVDSTGKEDVDSAVITVGPPDSEPTCTITAPADSATLSHGEPVVFEATVQDDEDPAEAVALSWESDVDGVFATDSADATGAATVSAEALSPGAHTVTLTATDTHGQTATDTVSFTLNQDPVIDGVTITPDPAYNDDTLVCSATATDGDGDTPTLSYEWTGGATGPELPLTSIIAASGDTLTCTATATDSAGATATATGSITLDNRDPTVTASLSPMAPTHHDTLTCTASDITDPDDDATTLEFTWTVGGTPVTASSTSGTVSTLAAVFIAGQTVACRTDIIDGKGGTATDTASVEIVNTAPTVTSVALTPEIVRTNDTVTAVASASDDDGDELTLSYAFAVNEVVVQEGSLTTLDGVDHFDKGQTVRVTVTATDGTDAHSLGSDSITVRDTPPTTPDIRIVEYADCEDGWVASEDRSQCFKIVSDPVDWPTALAGCAAEGGTLATIRSEGDNDTLYEMADGLGGESVWIGFNDRSEEGDWVWSSGEGAPYTNWLSEPGRVQPDGGSLENCAELFHSGVASPTWQGYWADMECSSTVHVGGYACETEAAGALQCVIDAGSTDADGDAVTYDFSWDVDGVGFTDTETTLYEGDTVPAEALGYEETWTCTVTPNDGDRDGESATASHTTEAPTPASCNDWLDLGYTESDTYLIDPTGSDPFEAYCDMTGDGGGWTLIAMVHPVRDLFLPEPVGWFGTERHTGPLAAFDLSSESAEVLSSFGTAPFHDYVTERDSLSRFTIHADEDHDFTYSWFKDVVPESFTRWFDDDTTDTLVCHDVDMTETCGWGIIQYTSDVTPLGVMTLPASMGGSDPIHMRLDGDIAYSFSAICSSTGDSPDWPDSYLDHWGNGLSIWLR